MLPERLIDLACLGDALERRLTFTNGNALLKFAQIEEISPDRQSNDKNKQEEEGNAYARVGILIQRCFHNLGLTKQRVFTLLLVVWRSSRARKPPPSSFRPQRYDGFVNGSELLSAVSALRLFPLVQLEHCIRSPHLNPVLPSPQCSLFRPWNRCFDSTTSAPHG